MLVAIEMQRDGRHAKLTYREQYTDPQVVVLQTGGSAVAVEVRLVHREEIVTIRDDAHLEQLRRSLWTLSERQTTPRTTGRVAYAVGITMGECPIKDRTSVAYSEWRAGWLEAYREAIKEKQQR